MKRWKTGIIVVVTAVLMSGCADYSGIEGYEEAVTAQNMYETLNSGKITVTDMNTGIMTQEFTFMYNANDILEYSYTGTDGETIYYEFHNGSEIDYTYADGDKWEFLEEGSDGYYSYTKSSKHPLASAMALSISPESISKSSISGNKITFEYDVEKLNANSADNLAEIGTLTSFTVEMELKEDGSCHTFRQIAEVENESGNSSENYLLEISGENKITEISRPKAAWET